MTSQRKEMPTAGTARNLPPPTLHTYKQLHPLCLLPSHCQSASLMLSSESGHLSSGYLRLVLPPPSPVPSPLTHRAVRGWAVSPTLRADKPQTSPVTTSVFSPNFPSLQVVGTSCPQCLTGLHSLARWNLGSQGLSGAFAQAVIPSSLEELRALTCLMSHGPALRHPCHLEVSSSSAPPLNTGVPWRWPSTLLYIFLGVESTPVA